MKKVQARVTTSKPPQEVYDYVVDFERQTEWRFDVLESKLVAGETGQVGARYRQRIKQGGREIETNVELTQAEPGHRVGFRTLDDAPVTASGTYTITATDSGSELTNLISIETHGFMRVLEPIMGPQLRKTAARYQEALEQRLR